MRTAQVMLSRGFGGAERSFVDTVCCLAEAGHEVLAVCDPCFARRDLLEGIDGVSVCPVKARGEWDLRAVWMLRKAISAFRPAVVHTQLRRAAALAGRAARGAGIPVVAKLHNYVDLGPYRHVSMLVATTRDEERYALEAGWPAERLRMIPNFTRLPVVESPRAPEAGNPCRLLSCGRFVEKKGFDVLLRAVAQVRAEGIELSLRLGGDGACRGALEALVRELGLDDCVAMGGWLDDVQAALDEADVFVLPSRDEPFGIVVLEAMARGVPVVSTRTQGPREILDDEAAFLAEIGAVDSLAGAIGVAVRDPNERRRRATRALALLRERYSSEAVIPQLVALYRELASW